MSSADTDTTDRVMPQQTTVRIAELPLERLPPAPDEILEGNPVWEQTAVWTSPDGSKMSGAFRSTPGRFKWHQRFHETTYVMSGHMIVTLEDGTEQHLKAGDLAHVLPGTRVEIEVVETVHDFFVITSTDGPVSVAP